MLPADVQLQNQTLCWLSSSEFREFLLSTRQSSCLLVVLEGNLLLPVGADPVQVAATASFHLQHLTTVS